jgi:flavodoxin
MNTLVIYDSQYGNTRQIAEAIAETLRPFGTAQAIRVDQAHAVSLHATDLLILGSPTQGFRPTPAMQFFVENISAKKLVAACFDTRIHGFLWKHSAAPYLDRQLITKDIKSLVPPESFFIKNMKKEGPIQASEVERATNWALAIHQQYETQVAHLATH